VRNYWVKYRQIIGEEKEKLWDAILIGLNKYYDILKESNTLCTKIEHMEKQNAELRRLLQFQKQCVSYFKYSISIAFLISFINHFNKYFSQELEYRRINQNLFKVVSHVNLKLNNRFIF
jgi:hypothetical protein